jgi:serine protease Do
MEENNQNEVEQNQQDKNEYIREKVKQRPLNRKKLMRRTIITAAMAVVFGVLACFTFLVLEPVFSNILSPEEEPEIIEIPEDVDEVSPEDMLLEDKKEPTIQIIREEADTVDPLDNYQYMYKEVYDIAGETQKSLVTVTGVTTDENWWGDEFESAGETSGLYVANNGRQILILAETSALEEADSINVTFIDGTTHKATIKQSDANSGLSIVSVDVSDVNADTISAITPARLGNSRASTLVASPVIAIGHPYGSSESVGFGMMVSKDRTVSLTDSNYEIMTTDIYGSEYATGIVVNLKGEVLGIIDQSYNTDDTKNLISAIGISDLKKTIERMSNGKAGARLGVTGTNVTEAAHEEYKVPNGAYVTGIVMNSPAMNYGIQSGDVIIKIDDEEIADFAELTECLMTKTPDTTVTVTIMRQSGQSEYREVELEILLDEGKK